MSSLDILRELTAIDRVLSDTSGAPVDRLHAAHGLHALAAHATGLPQLGADRDGAAHHVESGLPSGLALSAADAALCLHDYARTWAFAEGTRRAIAAARERFAGQRIRVLYAGTGPFAPMAALQIPHFSADEVAFTLVDVHAVSIAACRTWFEALGAADHVADWVTADATSWTPTPNERFHVIVAEIMQRALAKEPQVEVTRHVSQFLHPDGFFVPERIELELLLLDPADRFVDDGNGTIGIKPDDGRLSVGAPFEVTATSSRSLPVQDGVVTLPSLTIPMTADGSQPLTIATRIETFEGIALDEHASGLTTREKVASAGTPGPGDRLDLSYRLGPAPGLQIHVVPSPH